MISSTRITCTIATPRRSALNSAESATTCAIAPGDAPRKAEAQSQPWTNRRYDVVAAIIAMVATASIAMLSG